MRVTLSLALTLLLAASGGAQGLEPAWRAVDTWRQPQGLPQNTIITLFRSRDGYIWVGTKGGLARFDGVRFTSFQGKHRVTETEVWEIDEGPDSSLWIATYGGGVSRRFRGRFTEYTVKEGLISNFVAAVCAAREGGAWAGTDKGVSHIDPSGKIRNYTKADGLHANSIGSLYCAPDGVVWVGTSDGGMHFVEDGVIGPNLMASLGDPAPGSVQVFEPAKDGGMWVGATNGVLYFKDGKFEWLTGGQLSDNRSPRLYAAPDGALWIGNLDGLFQARNGQVRRHDLTPDLTKKQNVTAVIGDHEGSIWLGHGALGLVRIRQGQFESLTTKEGLPGPYVRTVMEDRSGYMWFGTGQGLTRYRDGVFQLRVRKDGEELPPVSSLVEHPDGHLWTGGPSGVARFRPRPDCVEPRCREDVEIMDNAGLGRMNVRLLYLDRAGAVWAGTDLQGLVRYDESGVKVFTTKDGLSDDGIRALAEDAEGHLWIGTKAGGVTRRLKDGRFEVFREADGLASDMIQGLYVSEDGVVWVATREGISRRMKDGRFFNANVSHGLYANHIYGMMQDRRGNMWMSCSRGIFRVPRQELDELAEGRRESVTSIAYGFEHGLNSTVGSAGYQPIITRSKDGRMWFATVDGASVVDPENLVSNTLAPQVHIESATIDGKSFDLFQPAHAEPGRGNLVFHYTALSFIAPPKVRFKVRLAPYDRDWVDAGGERRVQYTNIPPGHYTFRVMGANNDGVWNETGASYEVYLAPHFYQTLWFRGLLVLGAVLLGAATQRLRIHALKKRERELQERVKAAVADIKTLQGLLPICASCKKIRDDTGYWNQMETYIHEHSAAEFSHSVCPDCMEKLYPEYANAQRQNDTQ